jgi:3-isopropylmalate/(R)-2-methylmalate dehydratase small subunit
MKDNLISRSRIEGLALPLPGNDIDTDRIIPARYLKCVTFETLGAYAFYDERYAANGEQKKHPLNEERFKDAEILLVNKNFGCGSSREHAPQSLMRMGFRAIIGESFAEIFAGNCTALGIPAVILGQEEISQLMTTVLENPKAGLSVDLVNKNVSADALSFPIEIPESYRKSLIEGTWDTTATLLQNINLIKELASKLHYTIIRQGD